MGYLFKISGLTLLLSWLLVGGLFADIKVSSLAELQSAINEAEPGDVIILANGVYTSAEDIIINNRGTESKPITIAGETTGMVEIRGEGGFTIVSPSTYII